VTEDAVTRCFYVLRRQLSQAGGDRRYGAMIETLPKRGYRLNGEITQLAPRRFAATLKAGGRLPLMIAVAICAAVVLFAIAGVSSG
jgi:DNA-binding winged helix-turn-helix (wHTH) protein